LCARDDGRNIEITASKKVTSTNLEQIKKIEKSRDEAMKVSTNRLFEIEGLKSQVLNLQNLLDESEKQISDT